MQHINIRVVTVLLAACFSIGLGAAGCGDDELDYECTVTWSDENMNVVGEKVLDYANLAAADDAVAMCSDEQATDPERPTTSRSFKCDCAST